MSDIESIYRERRTKSLVYLAEKLEKYFNDIFKDIKHIDRISARAKDVDSFVKKSQRMKGGKIQYKDPLNEIQDQLGARIIIFYLDDLNEIENNVEKYFGSIEKTRKEPDDTSKFGYFGCHYVLIIPRDVLPEPLEGIPEVFELQIKTLFQHAWSEANHNLGYKPEQELSNNEKRKIAFTAAQAWGADKIFSELLLDGDKQN